jgi:hypothetical protein
MVDASRGRLCVHPHCDRQDAVICEPCGQPFCPLHARHPGHGLFLPSREAPESQGDRKRRLTRVGLSGRRAGELEPCSFLPVVGSMPDRSAIAATRGRPRPQGLVVPGCWGGGRMGLVSWTPTQMDTGEGSTPTLSGWAMWVMALVVMR